MKRLLIKIEMTVKNSTYLTGSVFVQKAFTTVDLMKTLCGKTY